MKAKFAEGFRKKFNINARGETNKRLDNIINELKTAEKVKEEATE